ncbi:MAG: DNA-binding domain-containing protein [Hyphomicrobiales bacterium]
MLLLPIFYYAKPNELDKNKETKVPVIKSARKVKHEDILKLAAKQSRYRSEEINACVHAYFDAIATELQSSASVTTPFINAQLVAKGTLEADKPYFNPIQNPNHSLLAVANFNKNMQKKIINKSLHVKLIEKPNTNIYIRKVYDMFHNDEKCLYSGNASVIEGNNFLKYKDVISLLITDSQGNDFVVKELNVNTNKQISFIMPKDIDKGTCEIMISKDQKIVSLYFANVKEM